MEIGVPREVRVLEKRVGLTPAGVAALTAGGHKVYIEHDAGAGAGFRDENYEQVGGQIVYSAAEAYGRASVVVKVARPTQQEHKLFQDGQAILSFLHLTVASPDLHVALHRHGITAIAYEVMQDSDGMLPILMPMSEVAGQLAPIYAGQLLTIPQGGRGILLGGLPGVARSIVLIVGAGTLGRSAARAFVGIGSQVLVLDVDVRKLRIVDEMFGGKVSTMVANEYNLNRMVGFADVLVGAVLKPGERAPILITRAMVQKMRPGSVIMDFSIDLGGCVETSRPTSLSDPTFVTEGVIHFCVPNLPAVVARTSSHALTNAIQPFLVRLAECGLECALGEMPALYQGVKMYKGKIASQRLARSLGREVEIDLAAVVDQAK
ncbi:MAG: alanine dehydrogenase [Anaerolineae bacterium]